ncbi:MAG: general secretion pathway protein GspB [Janthinobacterium lividum]
MSYILDALKKAQAERQLGHAPTIHAPPPTYAPPAGRASRMPLFIGLGAGAVVAALGVVFLMRQPAPAPAVQIAAAPPAAPAVAPRAAPGPAPATAPALPAPPSAAPAAAPAVPEPAPAAPAPEPVKTREAAPPKPAPAAAAPRKAEPAVAEAPPVAAAPDPARPAVAAAAPPVAAPAPAADDNVGPLAALPEAVQRDIPKVAFGGYIYSPNPAERLLLVDKMLRREGEEVAPGLVLERLLPKAAIMNYRGYRYRVAY